MKGVKYQHIFLSYLQSQMLWHVVYHVNSVTQAHTVRSFASGVVPVGHVSLALLKTPDYKYTLELLVTASTSCHTKLAGEVFTASPIRQSIVCVQHQWS